MISLVLMVKPENPCSSRHALTYPVVETILVYSKPADGPYDEVHALDEITIPLPSGNLNIYSDYDGTTVVQTCGGKASTMNFTIDFCATNATEAAGVLHSIHVSDAITVGVFLGNQNFTSCAALGGNGTAAPSAMPSIVPTAEGSLARSGIFAMMAAALAAALFL
jgi:hypothetical protein